MHDILETVEKWLNEGKPIALATVAATWGSSPRQAGAKMAVAPEMMMVGSVSGGCVESAVLNEALDSLKDGKPRLLNYGVSDDSAWEVGLACGGKISVYVEPLDHAWWKVAAESARNNRAAVTVSVIEGEFAGRKLFYDAKHELAYGYMELGRTKEALIQAAENAVYHQRKTTRATVAGFDVLIDVHRPNPRLVIIGGAHVAQALCRLAQTLGYEVIVIDPRSAFATTERFPAVKMISHQYPDKALSTLDLDSETYIAVLTHDPKIDDPALRTALPSSAPYIGVMSSKRSHALRIERLTKAGVDPKLIERIHTPIGLDIGAQSPEEIALSIMAEIVAVRNKNTE
ncbi:MAG: XdhC family protein [Aggregatilineales bacterium]